MSAAVYITAVFLSAVLSALDIKRHVHLLQLKSYHIGEYRAAALADKGLWLPQALISGTGALLLLILNSIAGNPAARADALFLRAAVLAVFFAAAFALTVTRLNKRKKIPLKFTPRLRRLYFATALFALMFSALAAIIGSFYPLTELIFLPPVYGTARAIVAVAACAVRPFENRKNGKYLAAAREKLAGMPELIKIGVTGSYGKTGVKLYLAAMLRKKYRVCASRGSFNTPMGLCLTVKGDLKADDEVLIAEMGARRAGDIRELCALIEPSYGILNSVAAQHLGTFGDLKTVAAAKYELIEALPAGGAAVFNCDNKIVRELMIRPCACKKISAGAGGRLICSAARVGGKLSYSAAETGGEGSEFVLNYAGGSVNCRTRLLGRHNIGNICAAAALALELGVTPTEIAAAVEELTPAPHRLELITGGPFRIIDDAYNSNPAGARAAIDVLAEYREGNRFIITPGLVEMGEASAEENAAVGFYAATRLKRGGYLLAIGGNAEYLAGGWLEGGGAPERVRICRDLNQAMYWLKELGCAGDTVLFENDVPDY